MEPVTEHDVHGRQLQSGTTTVILIRLNAGSPNRAQGVPLCDGVWQGCRRTMAESSAGSETTMWMAGF